jgi:phosphohistidine phosphatase
MPMRQLLLLRHAKSSWDDKTLPDQDRPLAARGQRAVTAMRAALHELGLAPDLVLLSSSRRTRETVELLEPWDDAPLIEPLDAIYLATAPQLLNILHGVAETVRSVMLVGHNPGLHELALLLLGPRGLKSPQPAVRHATELLAAAYPTGALAEFSIAGPWRQLSEGDGLLVRFLRPRDFPRDNTPDK